MIKGKWTNKDRNNKWPLFLMHNGIPQFHQQILLDIWKQKNVQNRVSIRNKESLSYFWWFCLTVIFWVCDLKKVVKFQKITTQGNFVSKNVNFPFEQRTFLRVNAICCSQRNGLLINLRIVAAFLRKLFKYRKRLWNSVLLNLRNSGLLLMWYFPISESDHFPIHPVSFHWF